MNTSASFSPSPIGVGSVSTPLRWAEFAATEFGICDRWLDGATVFDPTMGDGILLESLISLAIKRGVAPHDLPVHHLHGVEIDPDLGQSFMDRMRDTYGVQLPTDNFRSEDIFFQVEQQVFDIVFGNPPWCNFTDLPDMYKARVKEQYVRYGLAGDPRALLLGGSRIDIAALVIQKTIQDNLVTDGRAVFFIPLSLVLNDGANRFFRHYRVDGADFHIDRIVDFGKKLVFPNVKTRHGLIHICRNRTQSFPISYKLWLSGDWSELFARPLINDDDPLSISSVPDGSPTETPVRIEVDRRSMPRQGVNTCGANSVFFFDECLVRVDQSCVVRNGAETAVLPYKYIHPLLIGANFTEPNPVPRKWVLLPHTHDGKPMQTEEIVGEATLNEYLERHCVTLQGRKGALIGAWIKRGYWWSLMGVGPYSFAKHKIVWEAYGRKRFAPRVVPGYWQANQSLQAFIPCDDEAEAERLVGLLSDPSVEEYLLSSRMEGTMNWAQPGRIKRLMEFRG